MNHSSFKPAVSLVVCRFTLLTTLLTIPAWTERTRALANSGEAEPSPVKVWQAPITLPTYRLDPPDPNPMFYRHEVYQGAKKKIYPYPFQDKVTRIREERTYTALYLENDYIRLSVLPELGGRLFSALDKTNNYDFFYRQSVIKPALIGMLGAWISGGIEWCVFHHHRATTFMPVDYTLEENPDGSKTIWVGEIERRHRMKWLIGLTLYPDRSYIEATVKLFNRTPHAHSILYWANVAVHANENYQVIFPPSVRVATFHSKNDFVHWPVATGLYRGIDYSGVDLSWWKNHPEPISLFAWNLSEDFSGGYDHGKRAGVVHIGNHRIVTGAKLWEWSPGPRGRMWDEILTDEDGPYAELMVGAFSDNQPDYSWIKPYEVKTFKQYWYPVREIGGFKNANLSAAVNLELRGQAAQLGFHATSELRGAKAILKAGERLVFEEEVSIGPGAPFVKDIAVPSVTTEPDLEAALVSSTGRTLVSYRPQKLGQLPDLPPPVNPPRTPKEIQTNEELFLTGLRLQQMHSPTVPPEPYYEEALRRDPGDTRVNTIVGSNYNKRGMFQDGERHLRKAIERLAAEYTRPPHAEAYYHLGVSLRGQGRFEDAYDSFYRASWDNGVHSAAYQQLAELSLREGEWLRALGEIDHALATNPRSTKSLGLKAAILRKLSRHREAEEAAAEAVAADPLDFLALNETHLIQAALGQRVESEEVLAELKRKMRSDVQSYLELAVDYGNCGLWDEAIEVLSRLAGAGVNFDSTYPLLHYYLGYFHEHRGEPNVAAEHYRRAAEMPPDYGFAFRLESMDVLESALAYNPQDHRAHYYLGNLLYEIQPERAIKHWERSRDLWGSHSVVHRNLGWAYYRTRGDVAKAIDSYEKAVDVNPNDTRLYVELDQLYEVANVAPEKRLKLLTDNHEVVRQRSNSLLRELIVLVLMGKHDRAIRYLHENYFHVREGGGRVHDVFVDAHLLRGLARLKEGNPEAALADFEAASTYPENLSVGRPRNDPRAPQVAYYTGLAHEVLGDPVKAAEFFEHAAGQKDTTTWPETRFYQGLALEKLGRKSEASSIFSQLIHTGSEELSKVGDVDFFAKFGERDPEGARRSSAHYVIGLGHLGLGQLSEARAELEEALQWNASQVWAQYQLSGLE